MNMDPLHHTFRQMRRVFVALIGFTVLLIGVAMVVLPGPAMIVIPVGLAILATEFVWAKKTLTRIREEAARLKSKLTNSHKNHVTGESSCRESSKK